MRTLLRFAVVAGAAFGLAMTMDWATQSASGVADDISTGMMLGAIAFFLLVYALLIAVPFVPGIEIGIALLVLRGEAVAPYVYLATLAGLCLAYVVGQTVPDRWLHRMFSDLRLMRACRLIDRVAPLSRAERLDALRAALPRMLQPLAGAGRYVLLAILLNVPGNGLIGGGGGLSLLAGLSRVYAPGWTIATIAVAVLPVPLIVWIWGGAMLGLG
ncbi:MAG: hypothetical protein AAFW64_02505 [Pseudomonadota bacterium]